MELFVAIIITLYIGLKIYISVMQIGYIDVKKNDKPLFLGQKEFLDAASYAKTKERVSILESLVELLVIFFWLSLGFAALGSFVSFESLYLNGVIYIGAFLFTGFLISLPFDYYKKMVLDKRFGFSQQSVGGFVKDTIKSLLIGAIFTVLLSIGVIFFIENFTYWWIYAAIFIIAVVVFANLLYPTLIAPIFNKFSPLESSELKEEIELLLKRCGFKSSGVFVMDASKRDSRLNAYFGGLGGTKRVVLFDTLVQKLSSSEIISVLGHELGHYKHGDIYKNITISSVVILFLFFIFGNLPAGFFETFGIEQTPYTLIALLILLSSPITFFIMPLVSYFSRKAEFEADRFGCEQGSKEGLKNALLKLVQENKMFPLSHPIYIFFYYSHPPLAKRLEALGFEIDKL
ncbi:MAG: M48 family metallopeptidase [Campylobacterales bacterium]